jgi:hypothetical protein
MTGSAVRVDLLDFLEPTSQLWVQGKNEARANDEKDNPIPIVSLDSDLCRQSPSVQICSKEQ